MPHVLRALIVVLLASAPQAYAELATADEAGAGDRPNVLLVLVEALRFDQFDRELAGQPIMPNLQALAERGMHFESAWVTESWTKPSVVSFLTGLYPSVHKVRFSELFKPDNPLADDPTVAVDVLPESMPTLTGVLQKAGYRTGMIQTNTNLQPRWGFEAHYDHAEYPFRADAIDATDTALDFMQDDGEPFFLYLHYFDPHDPYVPTTAPEPMRRRPPGVSRAVEQFIKESHVQLTLDLAYLRLGLRTERQTPALRPNARAYARQLYDAETFEADRELGRLLAWVEANAPNTIVVVAGDHGEEFWEHGAVNHGQTAFSEVSRVPMVIYVPAIGHRKVSTPVSGVDVLPTICEAVGLDVPPNQGRSLLAPGLEVQPVFTEAGTFMRDAPVDFTAVVEGDWRYIYERRSGTHALYNIADDPL